VSVYLAKRVSPGDNPSALFLAKRLNGFAPAPINQLSILGVTNFPEVSYSLYRSYIDSFVFATSLKEKVFCQADAYTDLYLDTAVPFSPPAVTFSPSARLSLDQSNALLVKLGNDASMKVIGKSTEFTILKPSLGLVSRLLSVASPHYQVNGESVTPLGLQVFYKVISLIDGFLATNYYPAFSGDTDDSPDLPMTVGFAGRSLSTRLPILSRMGSPISAGFIQVLR
jgi:hypothetical protein